MQGIAVDSSTYKYIMYEDLYPALKTMAQASENRTLAENLLYWLSWTTKYTTTESTVKLQMAGETSSVFNRDKSAYGLGYYDGSVQNSDGSPASPVLKGCPVQPDTVVFDFATSHVKVTYDTTNLHPNGKDEDWLSGCDKNMFKNMGYLSAFDFGKWSYVLDMQTITTAVAVNLGLVLLDDLLEVHYPNNTIYGEVAVNYTDFRFYYDSRYAGMKPVACHSSDSGDECFILVGSTFLRPYLDDYGSYIPYPDEVTRYEGYRCDCSSAILWDSCDFFDIIVFLSQYNISAQYSKDKYFTRMS
jgi:hypothetical protein